MVTYRRHLRMSVHGWVRDRRLAERTVKLTDLVLSSKVEGLVADVQDGAAPIIKQDLLVPADDRHVEPTIRGEDLQPMLVLLPDFDRKLGLVVGIVGKETKRATETRDKVSFGPSCKEELCEPLHCSGGHCGRGRGRGREG